MLPSSSPSFPRCHIWALLDTPPRQYARGGFRASVNLLVRREAQTKKKAFAETFYANNQLTTLAGLSPSFARSTYS